MSRKENEIEEEREMVHHWSHHHPLTLVETRTGDYCYGCLRFIRSGENAYGCSQKCGYEELLHEECAKPPRNIRHAMHPQHILTQEFDLSWGKRCSICQWYTAGIIYRCTSPECMFGIHIRCAQGSDMMYAAAEDDEQSRTIIINHPSHPNHQLRLLRRSCSFKCDACGTKTSGKSYICNSGCQYWIHERCASLPHTIKREDHHHSLSLSFHLPPQYLRYDYTCYVCSKRLISIHWIYHCELCSYVVHLNCAIKKSPQATRREKGIMEFPRSDVGGDLIAAFVKRQGGDTQTYTLIPNHDVDYKFHNHKLRLVSSSQEEKQEEEDNSDDDGEDYSAKKSELICDACITPIFVKQRSSSSSSSSSSKDYYYMSCSSGCNYYLHLACFHLPSKLSSLPLIHQHDHHHLLQSSPKLKPWDWSYCSVCKKFMNGLFYACTECDGFKVDVKCASMPDTTYHAAHPQHPLNFIPKDETRIRGSNPCDGCGEIHIYGAYSYYECSSCEFMVCINCACLPASTSSRRWDRHHPLPLTYDATLNHPGDFYCDQCEEEMNPKNWMYHCRTCDLSFHPKCFKTKSGWYRNIKFGQKYVIAGAHSHTLTYQLLTSKRRCDVCGEDKHEEIGFHCALCNFFICFSFCGDKMIEDGDIEAVD